MPRWLCVHGHFYQPPRENPWLELIEVQDSAHPYHDWNERIDRECYAPNSVSRLMDEAGRIRKIVNNFEKISFNIGPTLFSWLADHDSDTYRRIIQADRVSAQANQGHGNAIAQVYNHMIMPLATERDRQTQVKWGIADFLARFGRFPEGMWLAETAACTDSLEALAENGILFTILCQTQAAEVMEPGESDYTPVNGVDPTRPYQVDLPSGRSIAVFFYDGPISQAVAFERLLSGADVFAGRLMGGFTEGRDWPQLLSIATDGETFGHHHRFGDMALAAVMERFDKTKEAIVTNYAAFLANHPPTVKVKIHEGSAWSCAHGVERWRSDCGCNIGAGVGWNQKWRTPLRDALDHLKAELDRIYETVGKRYFDDPWEVRERYIDVLLDRSKAGDFLDRYRTERTSDEDVICLKLLEMQRNGMLMFTSCGWFFDDLAGIETVQILQYAARAIQLAEGASGEKLEEPFLDILEKGRSNIPAQGDGRTLWRKQVVPEQSDLARGAANYAIVATLDPAIDPGLRHYEVSERERAEEEFGDNKLTLLGVAVRSRLVWERQEFLLACLRLGRTDVTAFLIPRKDDHAFAALEEEVFGALRRIPITQLIRALDRRFGGDDARIFQLRDLYVEVRRTAVSFLASDHIERFANTYRALIDENRRVIEYFIDSGVPIPGEFRLAAQYMMEQELQKAARDLADKGDPERIVDLMGDVQRWQLPVNLDATREVIEEALRQQLAEAMARKEEKGVMGVVRILVALTSGGLLIDRWRLQNLFSDTRFGKGNGAPVDPFFESKSMGKLAIMLDFAHPKAGIK